MTRVLFSKSAMRKALVLSFAVHAALFGVARPLALRPARAAPAPEAPPDRFAGTTADLPFADPGTALYDVSLDAPPPPRRPPNPRPSRRLRARRRPPPCPSWLPPRRRPPRSPRRARRRAPALLAASRPRPSEARRRRGGEQARADPGPASGCAPGGAWIGRIGGRRRPLRPRGPRRPPRSLGRAFARTIPLACQADPTSGRGPLGDAGKLDVAVHVDAAGHVTSFEPRGAIPAPGPVEPRSTTPMMLPQSRHVRHPGRRAPRGDRGAGAPRDREPGARGGVPAGRPHQPVQPRSGDGQLHPGERPPGRGEGQGPEGGRSPGRARPCGAPARRPAGDVG